MHPKSPKEKVCFFSIFQLYLFVCFFCSKEASSCMYGAMSKLNDDYHFRYTL